MEFWKIKRFVIALILTCLIGLAVILFAAMNAGCGSEITSAGAGIAGGFAASETFKGMQADLERREAALVAKYNELTEAGAKAEVLEEVRQQLTQTQTIRAGAGQVESIVKTDWSDPAAAGGVIGTISALVYALLSRRKLTAAGDVIRTIRAESDETLKHKIDKIILEKKAAV